MAACIVLSDFEHILLLLFFFNEFFHVKRNSNTSELFHFHFFPLVLDRLFCRVSEFTWAIMKLNISITSISLYMIEYVVIYKQYYIILFS